MSFGFRFWIFFFLLNIGDTILCAGNDPNLSPHRIWFYVALCLFAAMTSSYEDGKNK